MYPSDDEGVTAQPSFILPSTVLTKQYGEHETEEQRKTRESTDRVSDLVDEGFHAMIETDAAHEQRLIKDEIIIGHVLPDEDRRIDTALLQAIGKIDG